MAKEGVIQLQDLALSSSYPSFARKREPGGFRRWLLGPRFRGADEAAGPSSKTGGPPNGRLIDWRTSR